MKLQKISKPYYVGFVVASIDGRISLMKKTPPDWTSREDWHFFQEMLAKADAVVVGRHSYAAVADRLRKRNTYVLSRRLKGRYRRGTVTFVNPNCVNMQELLQQYQMVAVVGGGSVYQLMLDNGILDEIYITIEPLIFGRGTQMFVGGTKTAYLQLLSVKKLNASGTLLLHYKINYLVADI